MCRKGARRPKFNMIADVCGAATTSNVSLRDGGGNSFMCLPLGRKSPRRSKVSATIRTISAVLRASRDVSTGLAGPKNNSHPFRPNRQDTDSNITLCEATCSATHPQDMWILSQFRPWCVDRSQRTYLAFSPMPGDGRRLQEGSELKTSGAACVVTAGIAPSGRFDLVKAVTGDALALSLALDICLPILCCRRQSRPSFQAAISHRCDVGPDLDLRAFVRSQSCISCDTTDACRVRHFNGAASEWFLMSETT